jgi:hypothetical protein
MLIHYWVAFRPSQETTHKIAHLCLPAPLAARTSISHFEAQPAPSFLKMS